ncbi:cytochrome P450 [Mycena rosella]|uniref:Cytochrome P450 n=1 Tax=Mycena rosella TaxID=1033263 RepID=A0AAD7G2Z3_MYCRO|nr:cytochrome P450 [Mycena rosella]
MDVLNRIAALPPTTILGAGVVTFLVIRLWFRKAAHPLPPGPRGLPFLGNVLHLPIKGQWLTFTEWAKKYGDVIHVSAMGQSIIILSSAQAAKDLLDGRSGIYSDRPSFTFGGELVGYQDQTPLVHSGQGIRDHRKLMAEVLGPRVVSKWHDMEEVMMHNFLRALLRTPDAYANHIRRVIASIMFDISHGHVIAEGEDRLMALAEQAVTDFSASMVPGRYLVDTFPILRHAPEWVGFKREAKHLRKTMVAMRDEPWDMVKRQIAEGTAKPSFTTSLIERDPNPSVETEMLYKWVSNGLYTAAVDTTLAAMLSFFFAMSTHHDIQKKVQEELDRVVGHDRLPSFADRENLPYLEAVLKEVHRWHPVGPLAIPHRLEKDDVYNGFHIPGGSIVFPNVWAIMRDEALYPDAATFKPERFLDTAAKGVNPDPLTFAFGYGRRVCPGRDLANDVLFILAAMTLSVYNLRCEEENVQYTDTPITHPAPFKCSIKPRSREAETLISL